MRLTGRYFKTRPNDSSGRDKRDPKGRSERYATFEEDLKAMEAKD
jgi:hypothetical protein